MFSGQRGSLERTAMPNRYATDSAQLLIRLPEEMKCKLYRAVERLNAENHGAQYSANSVVRALIENFINGEAGGKLKK